MVDTKKKKVVTKVKPCCSVKDAKKKDTIFMATVIVEAAQSTVTRLGRDIDIVAFPLTYAKLKKLYEDLP
jgi:hypothetical protein|tara:strand:- start:3180 stop:3389 length:210 start_codon:yes stop_codon:yes gene_type:complete